MGGGILMVYPLRGVVFCPVQLKHNGENSRFLHFAFGAPSNYGGGSGGGSGRGGSPGGLHSPTIIIVRLPVSRRQSSEISTGGNS